MTVSHEIPVRFDKTHIITLGRRMYSESIDLIREMVNNAYDADATVVEIEITPNSISVRDNGSGMSLEELHIYFTIGSQHKKVIGRSKLYRRKLIGEMGIGKFSSLGVTTRFEVLTKCGDFKARVIFDQGDWESNESDWTVPCVELPIEGDEEDGTKVTLFDIEQHFTPQEIADRIRTTVPLEAKNFEVLINGQKIKPVFIKGRRFDVHHESRFGLIEGELVLAEKALPFSEVGIRCCVKDATITRSLFGYEDYGHGSRRITGRINADFVPFTSDRNDFLINTDEFKELHKHMRDRVTELIRMLKSEEDEKLIAQSRRALSKATQIVRHAFKQLPELIKEMEVIVTKSHTDTESLPDTVGYVQKRSARKKKTEPRKPPITKYGHKQIVHISPVTESKVLKKLKTDLGFSFGFVNEGENGPPSYFYGNTIYINRKHSLYEKFSKTLDEETNHLVRLLCAETIMLTSPADLRQYYERQIRVLTKAYVREKG